MRAQIHLSIFNNPDGTDKEMLVYELSGYNGVYEAFDWQPFTYDDVSKQVKTIQIHKASGFSLIASKIWKIVFTEFVEILTHILNCSVTSGLCPDRWYNHIHTQSDKSYENR